MLQGDGSEDQTDIIMRQVDLDGDGKVDYLEFIQAAINHQSLLNKDNILTIFNMFDSNGDGIIDRHELKEMFSPKSMSGITNNNEALWEEIMREVDQNQDNQISY